MAIKRYSHIPYDGPTEDEYGDYVLVGDHLDSHRFDEVAERVKFLKAYPNTKFFKFDPTRFFTTSDAARWDAWKACALAREKEFVA